ncbi:hypothetical protein Baya_1692 [Bagarius yarrelli]|uniref:Uncharacterized protein n=1 Tax=Bagarius yarrelli TaxID=175774 RepID=A0A556TLV4_BAGYA|nr:hypothetical protein Baya_1692 [Bagarius yarrelli]
MCNRQKAAECGLAREGNEASWVRSSRAEEQPPGRGGGGGGGGGEGLIEESKKEEERTDRRRHEGCMAVLPAV